MLVKFDELFNQAKELVFTIKVYEMLYEIEELQIPLTRFMEEKLYQVVRENRKSATVTKETRIKTS